VNPLFTINFRREAYLMEVARTRRRVVTLGVWVTYFGVLGLLLGLYGLNCASFSVRARQIERQAARLRGSQGASLEWNVQQTELAQVERFVLSPRRWHERLARLGMILPPNVRLTSLQANPQDLSSPAEQNRLVITGFLRPGPGQDRMQGVMRVVTTLRGDSVFTRSYRNIKLASTRISETPDAPAEFVIECR
jgi:Tfp pilus assembly protein PilN